MAAKFVRQAVAQQLLPDMAVAGCLDGLVPVADRAEVVRNRRTGVCRYQQLHVCASVWTCAVCADRILSLRQVEIARFLEWARAAGYTLLFVTLTASHHKWRYLEDGARERVRLADVLHPLTEAHRWMRHDKPWQRFKEDFGYIGAIRSTEITYGVHGWHPHIHELVALAPCADVAAAAAWYRARWLESLSQFGLSGDARRACQVRESGWTEAEYMAKMGHKRAGWDLDAELARGHVKQAGRGHATPWDMLLAIGLGEDASGGYGMLFREYARATFNRTAVRWSPGLKELAGVREVSDSAAAASYDPAARAELMGFLTRLAYVQVRSRGLQGHLLHVCEREGWEGVQRLIESLYLRSDQAPAPSVVDMEHYMLSRGPGGANVLDVDGLEPLPEPEPPDLRGYGIDPGEWVF